MNRAASPLASCIAGYGQSYETDTQPTDYADGNISCQHPYGQANHQATYENQASNSTSAGFLLLARHLFCLHCVLTIEILITLLDKLSLISTIHTESS